MKTYKFDSKGRNSPAYGCSEPGDNSGEYIKKADVLAALQSAVDGPTLRWVTLVDLISEIEESGEKSSSKQPPRGE